MVWSLRFDKIIYNMYYDSNFNIKYIESNCYAIYDICKIINLLSYISKQYF